MPHYRDKLDNQLTIYCSWGLLGYSIIRSGRHSICPTWQPASEGAKKYTSTDKNHKSTLWLSSVHLLWSWVLKFSAHQSTGSRCRTRNLSALGPERKHTLTDCLSTHDIRPRVTKLLMKSGYRAARRGWDTAIYLSILSLGRTNGTV